MDQLHNLQQQKDFLPHPFQATLVSMFIIVKMICKRCFADSESGVTNSIRDITGHITTIDELLEDTSITADVKAKLEETKSLLTNLETKFEALLKELQQSRKKRSSGTSSHINYVNIQFRVAFS